MFIVLIIIGGLGVPAISSSTGWATGALLLILTFCYDITVGPVCYSLVAELPSTRLRIKSVVLSRNVYNGKFQSYPYIPIGVLTDVGISSLWYYYRNSSTSFHEPNVMELAGQDLFLLGRHQSAWSHLGKHTAFRFQSPF